MGRCGNGASVREYNWCGFVIKGFVGVRPLLNVDFLELLGGFSC